MILLRLNPKAPKRPKNQATTISAKKRSNNTTIATTPT